MIPAGAPDADAAGFAAAALERRWRGLMRRHVAVAFGCACGAPVAHLGLAEVAGDILAYLRHRHPSGHDAAVDALLSPEHADESFSLLALLQRMQAVPLPASIAVMRLAADAERCIASCERSNGERRRALRADGGY